MLKRLDHIVHKLEDSWDVASALQPCPLNVLFFDRKAGSDTPWRKELWIYDLRTNQHFTRRTNPLARPDLDDFVEDLQVALAEFAELAESLQGIGVEIEAEVEL